MIALAVVFGLAAFYFHLIRSFNYWQKRGVKHDKPWPLVGNNAKDFLMLANVMDMGTEVYRKHPREKIVGFFNYSKPELVVRDLALAKRVLTDSTYFHRRSGARPKDSRIQPLLMNLFSTDDDLWRLLRTRMAAAFSSGKLKAMFPLIIEKTERLQNRLQNIADQNKPIDARDLMQQFTADVIGAIGFGINSDSLNFGNTSFQQLSLKIKSLTYNRTVKLYLKQIFPIFFGSLNVTKEIQREIVLMMKTIMQQRNNKPSNRNDFIDLLLECKKKGVMTGESIVEVNPDGSPKKVSIELDDDIMAAQIYVFFAAGFETSSSTMSHALHQLAHNPREQQKAQEEIDRVLAKHDNKLSYDAISEMIYLRWCLNEGLRIFPPGGILQRQCVRSCIIPDVDVTIDPGVNVKIPVHAFHNDPEIFPEPKEFRPERFDPEVLTKEQKLAYLPFGNGARACIAERMGLMQSLAGLAAVLAQFSVAPAPGAPRHPPTNPRSYIVQSFKTGLPLIFQQRTM
ncbi:cytochrome P450 6B6-like [Choristoneura fumiferana]